jgi:RNA polymerase primary sigma factor
MNSFHKNRGRSELDASYSSDVGVIEDSSFDDLSMPVDGPSEEDVSVEDIPREVTAGADDIGRLIAEMSRYPLLTREEEVALATRRDAARAGFTEQLLGSAVVVQGCFDAMRSVAAGNPGPCDIFGQERRTEHVRQGVEMFNRHLPTIEGLLSKSAQCREQLSQYLPGSAGDRELLRTIERLNLKIGQLLLESGLARPILLEMVTELEQKARIGLSLHNRKAAPDADVADNPSSVESLRGAFYDLGESPEAALARVRLVREFRNQEIKEIQALAQSNMKLVFSIAKKYENRGVPLLDLVQIGGTGLMTACDKFDGSLGCKFSTMAFYWIWQAITREVPSYARIVELPNSFVADVTLISRARAMLSASQGQAPLEDDLFQYLKTEYKWDRTLEELRFLIPFTEPVFSLDLAEVGHEDRRDSTLASKLQDSSEATCDGEIQPEERLLLKRAVKLLQARDPRWAHVLTQRFGLETGEEMTLTAIAGELGVSKERIRQIETKALEKMRELIMRDASLRPLRQMFEESNE